MKKLTVVILLVTAVAVTGYSQDVNWRSLRDDQQNLVQLKLGYDYGVTAQLGYHRSLFIIRPVLLGVDFSLPMGSDLVDDFKLRIGGQVEVFEMGGFSATLKIMSNFRRYENDLVRIASFGSDFAGVVGYYTPSWYAAGELGFDKAITSHLKHSDIMRRYVFAEIRNGWYVPTGGNWYYGIQGGKSIGESFDLSLRLGATNAQKKDEDAVLPLYAQLGLDVKF